jgi:hypothetical protein
MPKTSSLFLSTSPYFCENTETAVRIADAAPGLMVRADKVIRIF